MAQELGKPGFVPLLRAISVGLILAGLFWSEIQRSISQAGAPSEQRPGAGGPGTRPPAEPPIVTARREIPLILTRLYGALNKGDISSVQGLLTTRLASDARKLDQLCRPFTYRAHYIDKLLERPNGRVEVLVRSLHQPLEELARVLTFARTRDSFVLESIEDAASPPGYGQTQPWFDAEVKAGNELVRQFLYALHAGQDATVRSLISNNIHLDAFSQPSCQAVVQDLSQVRTNGGRMENFQGLKVHVEVYTSSLYWGNWQVWVDRVGDAQQIVKLNAPSRDCQSAGGIVVDPKLESYTLARFGLGGHRTTRASLTPHKVEEQPTDTASTSPSVPESVTVADVDSAPNSAQETARTVAGGPVLDIQLLEVPPGKEFRDWMDIHSFLAARGFGFNSWYYANAVDNPHGPVLVKDFLTQATAKNLYDGKIPYTGGLERPGDLRSFQHALIGVADLMRAAHPRPEDMNLTVNEFIHSRVMRTK